MATLLAQGESIEELAQYEDAIPEGARVRLICELSDALTQQELDALYAEIESQGVVLLSIREALGDPPMLTIDAEKRIAPLFIIGGALLGLVTLPIFVMNWRLMFMDPRELFRKIILPMVLIGVGGIIIIAVITRPVAEEAVKVTPEVVRAVVPEMRRALIARGLPSGAVEAVMPELRRVLARYG